MYSMVTMKSPLSWIDDELAKLKEANLLTEIRTIESSMDSHLTVNGKEVLNFCSNNYLGLADSNALKDAAIEAIKKYGIGPGAVRTIAGTNSLHIELEQKLAKFKKAEATILFQSGFCANLATVPVLVGENDVIFSDELNHASIIDACRLSKAEVIRYKHCNPSDLEEKIKSFKVENPKSEVRSLIVTDGVFSMDGDIAPLKDLQRIAEKYGAMLMVDDAHGEGVLGESGRGIVDHFGLHGKVDIEVGTLSKAFGVVGGFVSGKKELIEWLRRRGRPFLFSSAMTIPDTAAALASLKLLSNSDSLVQTLWKNTNYFKKHMTDLGFNIGNSTTPIVPVMLFDEKLAKDVSQELFSEGLFATPIVYPTVPAGKARIRVIISASHSQNDLDTALKLFEKVGRKHSIIT